MPNRHEPILFFDCNATLGRPASPILGSWLSDKGMIEEMDRFGIAEALVTHVFAQELNFREGNEIILETTSTTTRLHSQGTVFPTYADGSSASRTEIAGLVARGCRAFRLHPNPTHHIMDEAVYSRQYPFVPDVVGEICAQLQNARAPVFVEMAQVIWAEVYDMCRTFPHLPIVLLNVSYTHKRSLFAGFDKYDNLYCDTSGYHAYRGLEEICGLFGAHRMVFGTRLPSYSALAGIAMVRYANISADERQLIAGENLRRLLLGERGIAEP